ncbi:oncostatin-M [Moschus berezovskii]|uniref:oncostatin-M n=1 Tax=Moschus berezovskii TaxID=68408 RepID=UPI0024448C45|nr:oncostatin-M [Moschus berezovskii]
MRAQRMQRTLPSLVLRLLFLGTVAMGKCSGKYHELLLQLQRQADLMQDPSTLLDPYVLLQGLHSPILKEHCRERPGDFPSEDALWKLSRQDFLRTLNATLGLVLRMLSALQQGLPEAAQQQAEMYIRGFGNNIHCMTQLLHSFSDPEAAEPTPPGPGPTLPPPLPTPPSTFQRKLRNCGFLRGYHRFMHAAGQVLRGWGERRGHSLRHRPRRALQRGARRTRPFLEVRRLVPRGQLPR